MILVCPDCATSFSINATLPPEGRKVRCSKCAHVWSATPPPEPAPEPRPEPEAAIEEETVEEAAIEEDPFKDLFDTPLPEEAGSGQDFAIGEPPGEDTMPSSLLDELEDEEIAWAEDEDVAPAPEPEETGDASVEDIQPTSQPEASMDASFEEDEPVEDVEIAAETTAPPPRRSLARAAAGWGAFAAIAAMLAGGGVIFRDTVVRTLPASAGIYERLGLAVNLRGMEIRDVRYARDIDNGLPVIIIQGRVVNITDRVVAVPKLRFALRDGMQRELYTWMSQMKERVLTPAAVIPFKTRLTSPPLESRDVEVRFVRPGEEG